MFFLMLMGYNYSYLLENEHEKKFTESLLTCERNIHNKTISKTSDTNKEKKIA